MMRLRSPYSFGVVEVPEHLVDRYKEAGFTEQEPEVVEAEEAPAPRKRRASKSE